MFWKIHGNSILDIIHMLKSVVFVPGAFHVPNILVGMVGLCWIIVYSKAKKNLYFVVDVLLRVFSVTLPFHKVKSRHDGSKG